MSICRYKIEVRGTVQGIGFRPFVYKEALKLSLLGHVFNHSSGVTIEAQGRVDQLEQFLNTIKDSHPPFADIHSIEHAEIDPKEERAFNIIKSKDHGTSETLISADIATCNDCLRDISDPNNRRYRYPFTNCTNCGPRYTIIEGVPYDRPLTAMKGFKMCTECESEYADPMDRRYHAQPNCCPVCGPRIQLLKPGSRIEDRGSNLDTISHTYNLLKQGNIIAIKGLGGFHLACDATNEDSVKRLRERKKRDEKPFAVMMDGVEMVRRVCEVSEDEERLLTSAQRPIVLLRRKIQGPRSKIQNRSKIQDPKISDLIAPGNCYLGVMLPYTPLHYLLFSCSPSPLPSPQGGEGVYNTPTLLKLQHPLNALVMTSANISDEPICYDNDEAIERLKDIADYFLLHDRDIYIRTDDSIGRVVGGRPLMLRRARGYVPQPVVLDPRCSMLDAGHILAVGAGLKNTVCFLKGGKAFLSQHIGDLENTASYESFEKTIQHLQELYDIRPSIIAHDMHPDYFSTRWTNLHHSKPGGNGEGCPRTTTLPAGQPAPLGPAGVECIRVQHHHAHIASCMAENRIDGPVIGIALDGTGFGSDGNVWGGEFLVADFKGFERVGQFEYVPMPGGEAAIKNPWMMAVSYLYNFFGPNIHSVLDSISFRSNNNHNVSLRAKSRRPDEKVDLVLQMIDKEVNSPLTSSCGRLFDAVGAILGIRQSVSYEGQGALELEMLAAQIQGPRSKIQTYSYDILDNDYITISYRSTIKALLEDLIAGISRAEIALKFHYTIIAALSEAALKISQKTGLRDVALSGGCFQNVILTEGLKKSLESEGMKVYTHSLVPPNDGGISLGQTAIARAQLK